MFTWRNLILILITLVCLVIINKGNAYNYFDYSQKVVSHEKIVSNTGWTEHTFKVLDAITKIGIDKDVAVMMINTCKVSAKDAMDCIRVGSMISMAESSGGKRCYNYGCWGVQAGIDYTSRTDAFKDWVVRYNKHWYKNLQPKDFYGKNSKTGYCKYEVSSGTDGWCPDGLKASQKVSDIISLIDA